jgi:hypothetical protein
MLDKNNPLGGMSQQELEELIEKAAERLREVKVTPCDVCAADCTGGSCKNFEGLSFTITWGYDSRCKDGSHHTLTICEACYDTFITNGPLGKYVKITNF